MRRIKAHKTIGRLFFFPVLLSTLSCGGKEATEIEGQTPSGAGGKREMSKADYANPDIEANPVVDYTKWKIENGKFYLDGERVFLKIAKPLYNYGDATEAGKAMASLDTLKNKHYNAIELNCYWHQFDTDGDGEIDVDTSPLRDLVDAIYAKGMYPCLTVETYAVGGGQIPEGFWERFPDAEAITSEGYPCSDTEYGFGSKVVSIFHEGYRNTVHKYIKNLASSIDTKKILWFETTVEPQYMSSYALCYSESARKEYQKWRAEAGYTDKDSEMPESFPIPSSFVANETWNKFRAQFLAKWVNEDAAAYREIAGDGAYVAVDYLDAAESVQYLRDGDPIEFLTALTCADIIQVNWHWYTANDAPNQKAYDRVMQVKNATKRDWAVSEHMTFNGQDYSGLSESQIERLLENTLAQGTRLGWEFTNTRNSSSDDFCLYRDNWKPKYPMSYVDNYWGYWLHRIEEIEK